MSKAALFTVIWTRPAAGDLEAILDHIAAESRLNARRLLARFRRTAASLCRSPARGRIVPELADQGITHYREVILSPWRIIYRIGQKEVYVLVVIDGRRNVEDVLLERLTRQP